MSELTTMMVAFLGAFATSDDCATKLDAARELLGADVLIECRPMVHAPVATIRPRARPTTSATAQQTGATN